MPAYLDGFLGGLWELFADSIEQTAPRCQECGEVAIPFRCVGCNTYSCKDHGFFSISERRSICFQCALRIAGEATEPSWSGRTKSRKRAVPWEALELDENATAEDINRAFRKLTLMCHPDLHPGDPDAAKQFKGLQRARELCLEAVQSREEE